MSLGRWIAVAIWWLMMLAAPTGADTSLAWWGHQRAWINDAARFRVCCKARQIGMSTAVAAEALNAAVFGQTTVIISASQRQASELLRKATVMLPLVAAAGDGAISVDRQSAEWIALSTGGRVISLPASAATVQGFSGNVVIDEAAWMPDADQLWAAIVPTISTNTSFRLSVLSTPGARGGMFHKLWHNGDPAWSRHRIDIYAAKAAGAPHDVDSLRQAVADEVTWRSAYECEFVDESHSLLPYDLLQSRIDADADYHLNTTTLLDRGPFYAGFDVGRKHDLSVLIVLRKVGAALRWCGAIELRKAPFDEQFRVLSDVMRHRGVQRLCIDQSGLGMQLAEQLVSAFGSQVEPVTMTAPVKEAMASRILAAFQTGEVSIPDHRPLIDDLHSMQRSITIAGNLRYSAPRDAGSHADRWTALALACMAGGDTVLPVECVAGRATMSAGMRSF